MIPASKLHRTRLDPELGFLLLYNLGLVAAYFSGQAPMLMILGYYVQAIFIGLQTWLQACFDLKRQQVTWTGSDGGPAGILSVLVFPVVFVVFVGGYGILLFNGHVGDPHALGGWSLVPFLSLTVAYGVLQLAAYLYREASATLPNRSLADVSWAYARIWPLHFFIMMGGTLGAASGWGQASEPSRAVIVFFLLKTVVDLVLYTKSVRQQQPASMRN